MNTIKKVINFLQKLGGLDYEEALWELDGQFTDSPETNHERVYATTRHPYP